MPLPTSAGRAAAASQEVTPTPTPTPTSTVLPDDIVLVASAAARRGQQTDADSDRAGGHRPSALPADQPAPSLPAEFPSAAAATTVSSGGKGRRRRRSAAASSGATAAAADEASAAPLDSTGQALYARYCAVEAAGAFLAANKMPRRLPALQQMVPGLELVQLQQIAALVPQVLELREVSSDRPRDLYAPAAAQATAAATPTAGSSCSASASPRSIELAFRRGFGGQMHQAKRLRLVRAALAERCAASPSAAEQTAAAPAASSDLASAVSSAPAPQPPPPPGPSSVKTAASSASDLELAPVQPYRSPGKRKRKNLTGDARPPEAAGASPSPNFDPKATLAYLQTLPLYTKQLVHTEHVPSRAATFRQLERPLPDALRQALSSLGFSKGFFRHQAQAIDAARRGEHCIISTATASGKSLCYNVPVFEALLAEPEAVAFYLFPTKALAQDQLRSLRGLTGSGFFGHDIICRTLDGDTPLREREEIRTRANLILTNPDLLHCTLLPQHAVWARLFANLRVVVIDEAHTYRGIFGTHVGCVMRRLVRVCRSLGNDRVQFIGCSATLGNPKEHFRLLVSDAAVDGPSGGGKLCVIDEDASPRGGREFAIWNPVSMVHSPGKRRRRREAQDAAAAAASAQQQTPGGAPAVSACRALNMDLDDSVEPAAAAEQQQEGGFFPPLPPELKASSRPAPEAWLPRHRSSAAGDASDAGGAADITSEAPAPASASAAPAAAHLAPIPVQRISDIHPLLMEERPLRGKSRRDKGADTGKSSIFETAMLLSALVKQRVRTLAFCSSRNLVELVLKYTKEDLESSAPELANKVRAYRAGYTKEERRKLERDLFSGRLLGIAATNALELGVDIGMLDVTLLLGFPGSVASLWQQAGRSGRSGRDSLSIMICFNSPVDQHYARNPEELLHRAPETVFLDPLNKHVLRDSHLLCAAAENPLAFQSQDAAGGKEQSAAERLVAEQAQLDSSLFGPELGRLVGELVADGLLRRQGLEGGRVWTAVNTRRLPASRVNLRVMDDKSVKVLELPAKHPLDEMEWAKALFFVHPGAVFMHQAETYLVKMLDLEEGYAHAVRAELDYFTLTRDVTTITIMSTEETRGPVHLGEAQISLQVYGFKKMSPLTHRAVEVVDLPGLPPVEFATKACWLDVPPSVRAELCSQTRFRDGWHAAQHALVNMLPLVVMCDMGDVKTEHADPEMESGIPYRLIICDARAGGVGLAEATFHSVDKLLALAIKTLDTCDCEYGCPACIASPSCTTYNEALDKRAGLVILRAVQESL